MRAHALQYLRKSDMDPERRKFLKRSVLFFTASVREEFHHGEVGRI
jgi:hypothetical protein